MNWLTPLTGLLVAAAVIPPLILLYFLKLRRRPAAISSTLLWKKAIEDLQANAPFQKLRKSLLLLLQLLALALLALSLMQPQIQGGNTGAEKTVIIIDNSASMTATDTEDGKSRLEQAKRRARERVETLYAGGLFASTPGETMIVSFADGAEIHARFTESKRELLQAIDRIPPTHGTSSIADALKLARAHMANPDPEIERAIAAPAAIDLYSDGRIFDIDQQVKREASFVYHPIGTAEPDNVAVTSLSVERPFDRPSSVEVFASLVNFNLTPVTCDVELSVDDGLRAVEEVDVAAATIDPGTGELNPARQNVLFTPFEQPRGAVIGVRNLRDDHLEADNNAQVVVPPPKQLDVAIVSPGRTLVRSVLEGMSLQSLEVMSPARFEQLATENALGQYDVVVLDGYEPETISDGRFLSFGPTPPIEGLNEFGESEPQVVLDVQDEHPALRFVALDNLYIEKAKLLEPAEDIKVLVEGSSGPLVLAIGRGPMQMILVTFDPVESNWPFQRGFVTFVFNAVEFLGHVGEGLTEQGFIPGEALLARLPADARGITITVPDGTNDGATEPIETDDPTRVSWGPIRLAGIYLLEWASGGQAQSRQVAVNLATANESRIDVREEMVLGADEITVAGEGDGTYTPLWPYAVGLTLLVLMIEWWIYHRKVMV